MFTRIYSSTGSRRGAAPLAECFSSPWQKVFKQGCSPRPEGTKLFCSFSPVVLMLSARATQKLSFGSSMSPELDYKQAKVLLFSTTLYLCLNKCVLWGNSPRKARICMVFALISYFQPALEEKFEMLILSLKNWSLSGQQNLV